MSPDIQERSHKCRSRINNLYLLTRPIGNIGVSFGSNTFSGSELRSCSLWRSQDFYGHLWLTLTVEPVNLNINGVVWTC